MKIYNRYNGQLEEIVFQDLHLIKKNGYCQAWYQGKYEGFISLKYWYLAADLLM